MNAAQELFLKQGVGPTTVDQITSGADVAKGTFYLHFDSKEDLLAALRERFVKDFMERVGVAVDARPANDWQGKLGTSVKTIVHGYLDALALHDIVFHDGNPRTRDIHDGDPVIDHFTALIEGGVTDGVWSVEDCQFTAIFLFAAIHGAIDDALLREKKVNRPRLIRNLQRLCFRTVGLANE
jgi:AcrR family transcriptional regulator